MPKFDNQSLTEVCITVKGTLQEKQSITLAGKWLKYTLYKCIKAIKPLCVAFKKNAPDIFLKDDEREVLARTFICICHSFEDRDRFG